MGDGKAHNVAELTDVGNQGNYTSGSGNVYLDGELASSYATVPLPSGLMEVSAQTCTPVAQWSRAERTETYMVSSAELKKSGTVVGDIYTPRIAIEDGAFLEGHVRVHKDTPPPQTKKEAATFSGRVRAA